MVESLSLDGGFQRSWEAERNGPENTQLNPGGASGIGWRRRLLESDPSQTYRGEASHCDRSPPRMEKGHRWILWRCPLAFSLVQCEIRVYASKGGLELAPLRLGCWP